MSIQAAAATAGASTDPAATSTPTVTHYQQVADQVCKALDDIAVLIPKLELTHASTAKFVRSHLNVPTEFLATAIAVVEQVPELSNVNKLDVVGARDTLQFIEAFRPVADKAMAFAKSVTDTISLRKANLAADSLQVYAIAKGLARDRKSGGIASLVANLKRDLGRRGRPKGSVTGAGTPPVLMTAIAKGGLKKAA
jgi:hypothetical protein